METLFALSWRAVQCSAFTAPHRRAGWRLGTQDTGLESGDEGDDDSEPAS
jgi:hypothetical protein